MTTRPNDTGHRGGDAGWNVKIGGDRKAGAAVENHILDSIALALDHCRDTRIQRRPRRLGTKRTTNPLLRRTDVLLRVLLVLQLFQRANLSLSGLANLTDEELVHHAGKTIERLKLLGFLRGGGVGPRQQGHRHDLSADRLKTLAARQDGTFGG